MKNILISFLTIIALQACGQSPAKMPDHKNIKGTAVWILPPVGFIPSSSFKGFVDSVTNISMIMLTEMPGPYTEIIKPFASAAPLPNGMVVKDRKIMRVADWEALLVHMEQTAGNRVFEKHILIFGDSSHTILINGVSLKDSSSTSRDIEKALTSIFYDEQQIINPRNDLDYSLDESKTKLKFSAVMGNSMLFSVDGKMPTQSNDKTGFIIDKSYATAEIKDQKQFCVSRFEKLGYKNSQINMDKGIKEITIDGLPGFALYGTADKKTDAALQFIYQIILFGETGYYLLLGLYEEDTQENVSTVEQMALTFKRK